MDEPGRTYRIRGAKLVYSPEHRTEHTDAERFFDGDIISFRVDSIFTKTEAGLTETTQCFRVGSGGSTLTPVARGSWL